jgi:putative tryptophan/tyrosine transport system substrate-binding protein
MKRRHFIGMAAAAIGAGPLTAHGQQPAAPVIGYLASSSPNKERDEAFRRGLAEQGYVDGRDVTIEFLFAHSVYERLPAFVQDFQNRRVAVIMASGNQAAFAGRSANLAIPIVFAIGDDPIQAGLVSSMNRPVGNMTGHTFYNSQLVGKRLGLLHQLTPRDAVFALLVNPATPNYKAHLADTQKAAEGLGRRIEVFTVKTETELEQAFSKFANRQIGGSLHITDPFFNAEHRRLAALALQHRVPGVYPQREYAQAGGLLSYGASIAESHRQAGNYVGRILRGEKPTDLPVTLANKFDLVLNLKTAKVLGVEIAPTLLALADEVIE